MKKGRKSFLQYIKDGEKVNREDENFYKDYLQYVEDKKKIDCDVCKYKNERYQSLNEKYNIKELERFRLRESEAKGLTFLSGAIGIGFTVPTFIVLFLHVDGPIAGLNHLSSNKIGILFALVGLGYTLTCVYNIIRNIRVSKKIKEAKKELGYLK